MHGDSPTNDPSRASADALRLERIASRLEHACSTTHTDVTLLTSPKQSLELVESLFADHPSSLARERCRDEMFKPEREDDRVSDLVYGEVGFLALVNLFTKWKQRLPGGREVMSDQSDASNPDPHEKNKSRGVFLDLGSGIGRPVFSAACLAHHVFHTVVGIEVLKELHSLAFELNQLYEKEIVPKFGDQAPAAQFLCGDFLSDAVDGDDDINSAWRTADCILINSCCFGDTLWEKVKDKARREVKKECLVVTLRRSLLDPQSGEKVYDDSHSDADHTNNKDTHWELLETSERQMSWGACEVFVHCKR